jgi:hypothetical protein
MAARERRGGHQNAPARNKKKARTDWIVDSGLNKLLKIALQQLSRYTKDL